MHRSVDQEGPQNDRIDRIVGVIEMLQNENKDLVQNKEQAIGARIQKLIEENEALKKGGEAQRLQEQILVEQKSYERVIEQLQEEN